MVSLMQRRRAMMQAAAAPTPPAPTPVIPDDYQQVEYVLRSASVSRNAGYNSLNYTLNGTDEVEIRVGAMAVGKHYSSSGGYVVGCRQKTNDNTVGYGISFNQNNTSILSFDGTVCDISPNGGSSILNTKFDLVATKTQTGQSITDGTNSNATTGTPRAMATTLYVFAMKVYSSNNANVPFTGRIYYLKVKEAGVTVIDLIPCKRKSDNAVGFWDLAQERFVTNANYTAGPDVT